MLIYTVLLVLLSLTYSANSSKNASIIIVGAGPSAVAAATKLIKHGITNFKILEAENRIGGRINSVFFGDAYVDLGAEFVHGEKGNIVYSLAKDYNILVHNNFSRKLYYSHGDIDKELETDLVNFAIKFYDLTGNVTDSKLNTEEFFFQQYNSTIVEKYKNDKDKLKIVFEAIDFFENTIITTENAFSWNDVSVETNYIECDGDQNLDWNGLGYKTILEILMQSYPDPKKILPMAEKTYLSKEVININWQNEDEVIVKCADGSEFKANQVIFTPSVGVLKAKHSSLFTPALPEKKIKAIENIGFGAIVKVILSFKNTWWKPTDTSFTLFWSSEDKAKLLSEFPNEPTLEGNSWFTDISFIIPAENNPKVLILWIAGKMVPQIEKLPDKQIQDGCVYVLKKFLSKKYTITEPESIIRSSWYSNPNFRGSWSYETIGAKNLGEKFQGELAKPIVNSKGIPTVLFAGEASHSTYFSTVHGAIETGFREADRIIELYK